MAARLPAQLSHASAYSARAAKQPTGSTWPAHARLALQRHSNLCAKRLKSARLHKQRLLGAEEASESARILGLAADGNAPRPQTCKISRLWITAGTDVTRRSQNYTVRAPCCSMCMKTGADGGEVAHAIEPYVGIQCWDRQTPKWLALARARPPCAAVALNLCAKGHKSTRLH